MGFGSLLKKVAKTGASVALKTATQAATGGLGGVAVGAIKLATDKEDRVQQLTGVLANAAGSGKLKGVAELMDDITSLGKLVKSARADKQITMEEMDAIFEAVEQLEEDAKGALGGLV